jgi:hypothetical protein
MTGLVRKAILITVGASMYAGAAMAITPSAANSNFPAPNSTIMITGKKSTNAPAEDARGQFSVTVRDGSNLVIQGATVTLNFNACTPDIILSRIQSFAGVSILCNGVRGVVSAQTNNLGVATFRILGGSNNVLPLAGGNNPGNQTACAELRANGVFFTNLAVSAPDETNNLNGVNGGDLGVLISDINHGNLAFRDDVNKDGAVNPGDVGTMITIVNQDASGENTAALCP